MRPFSAWQLYVILDYAAIGQRDAVEVAAAAIRGGADVLQLRHKEASAAQLHAEAIQLVAVTRAAGIPLIINDHPDVAQAVGAQGVHLGQDDLPLAQARSQLGHTALIGKSTHSVEQALAAEAEGADYIGLGPVFPTPTKPAYGSIGSAIIAQVVSRVRVPVVCIGGIEQSTINQVCEAGGHCVAVVRAVCAAADPESATRELKRMMNAQSHRSNPSIPL